jgi:formylglycine-generating enzyme required for sulfatase activity
MGSNNRPSDYSPAHIAEVKNPFWMAEMEITNEQFRTVFPDHDSRFHDQQWKDHVNEGYPANKPEQPVIRVSWNEAMEFCRN